jgi:hypothetical protein
MDDGTLLGLVDKVLIRLVLGVHSNASVSPNVLKSCRCRFDRLVGTLGFRICECSKLDPLMTPRHVKLGLGRPFKLIWVYLKCT